MIFLSSDYVENLSLQYVNSMNWTVISRVGVSGGENLYGCPSMHSMSSLSLALQWHLWVLHVHGSNHGGTVFSCGSSLYVPAFMSE